MNPLFKSSGRALHLALIAGVMVLPARAWASQISEARDTATSTVAPSTPEELVQPVLQNEANLEYPAALLDLETPP
ncbi:MAG: hypothetical protein ACPHRO_07355, partial [Nannocystaceae bacterium]